MKKLAILVALLVVLVVAVPASAASWTERISGGMSYAYPYGEFTVTLSAWQKADLTYGGEGQYYYPPLNKTFHLDVTKVCVGTVSSGPYAGAPYAVGMGTVRGQDGTVVSGDGFGAIAVAEGGDAGDGVRVWFDMTKAVIDAFCDAGAYDSFPARVVDGNFNIRSK